MKYVKFIKNMSHYKLKFGIMILTQIYNPSDVVIVDKNFRLEKLERNFMKAQWLVELDLFEDTELDLIQAIKDSGRELKTVGYIPFDDDLITRCSKLYNDDDCVIFYGSLNFGKKLRKMSWVPGVYLNEKKFECTAYYPTFGNELLHQNYIMLPYGDLIRKKDFIFKLFGDDVFIRPNSGLKQFTGTVLNINNFDDGVRLSGFYDVDPELLCLVSDAKLIKKEWRFVIVNNEAISGSLYRDWTIGPETLFPDTVTKDIILLNSKGVKELCTDDKAFEYANKIAKIYSPDAAWTLDITLTEDNEYKVIEIGCFSCAGLYGNDLNKVVEAVSKAAENEWTEYNEV